MRTYSKLILIPDFKSRFDYLNLHGFVGKDTFGFDRYLNQVFYKSSEWRSIRNFVMIRDNGCDLSHNDFPIQGKIYIHHLNPITQEDILKRKEEILNPEFLVCVSFMTHQAIHYGDYSLIDSTIVERREGDTCPWKKSKWM